MQRPEVMIAYLGAPQAVAPGDGDA